MKLIERHEFTNNKAFETLRVEEADARVMETPKDDVIAFRRISGNGTTNTMVMRPDEALLMARMLINAVYQVTSGYEIEELK